MKNRRVPFIYPELDRMVGRPFAEAESINYRLVARAGGREVGSAARRAFVRDDVGVVNYVTRSFVSEIVSLPNRSVAFTEVRERRKSIGRCAQSTEWWEKRIPVFVTRVPKAPVRIDSGRISVADKSSRCYSVAVTQSSCRNVDRSFHASSRPCVLTPACNRSRSILAVVDRSTQLLHKIETYVRVRFLATGFINPSISPAELIAIILCVSEARAQKKQAVKVA